MPRSLAEWGGFWAGALLLGGVLSGCNQTLPGASTAHPAVGECHLVVSREQFDAVSEPRPPVACTEAHTAQTYKVTQVPNPLAPSRDDWERGARAVRCDVFLAANDGAPRTTTLDFKGVLAGPESTALRLCYPPYALQFLGVDALPAGITLRPIIRTVNGARTERCAVAPLQSNTQSSPAQSSPGTITGTLAPAGGHKRG